MGKGRPKTIKEMTNDEIIEEVQLYSNIEFEVNDSKFVFRNINIETFNDFNKVKVIRLLLQEIDWYHILTYDEFDILGEKFILIDRTKSKVVLVRKNSF
jgi:hypothetical protein